MNEMSNKEKVLKFDNIILRLSFWELYGSKEQKLLTEIISKILDLNIDVSIFSKSAIEENG